ncbi:hypothetical protein AAG906_031809 [Vitis piasezkii]
MVGSSDVGSKVWLSYFDLAQGIGHYKWRLGSSQEHRVTKRTLDMGGGKAFLILCILLFIPSEGLVVSNTPKPNDPRTIGQQPLPGTGVCPSRSAHARGRLCMPRPRGGGRPPAP